MGGRKKQGEWPPDWTDDDVDLVQRLEAYLQECGHPARLGQTARR